MPLKCAAFEGQGQGLYTEQIEGGSATGGSQLQRRNVVVADGGPIVSPPPSVARHLDEIAEGPEVNPGQGFNPEVENLSCGQRQGTVTRRSSERRLAWRRIEDVTGKPRRIDGARDLRRNVFGN